MVLLKLFTTASFVLLGAGVATGSEASAHSPAADSVKVRVQMSCAGCSGVFREFAIHVLAPDGTTLYHLDGVGNVANAGELLIDEGRFKATHAMAYDAYLPLVAFNGTDRAGLSLTGTYWMQARRNRIRDLTGFGDLCGTLLPGDEVVLNIAVDEEEHDATTIKVFRKGKLLGAEGNGC